MKYFRQLNIVLLITIFISSNLAVNAQNKTPYDELITDDIIYFQHVTKPSEDEFPNANQAIFDWMGTLDDILEWRVLRSEWDALTEHLGGTAGALSSLCGNDFAYAVSGFGDGGKIPTVMYMSYVDDPNTSKQAMAELIDYIASLHEVIESEHDEFRGFEIHSLFGPGNIPGLSLSYTFHENLLIITTSKPYLASFVDELGFIDDTLAKSAQYRDALNRLPQNNTSISYLNLGELSNTLDILLEMGRAIQTAEQDEDLAMVIGIAEEVMEYVKKVKYYASAKSKDSTNVHVNTGFIHFDPTLLDTPFGALLNTEPVRFDFASYLPRKAGTFQAGNIYTISQVLEIIDSFVKDMPEKAEFDETVTQFEEEIGMSIEEDTFDWLGDEWCFLKPVMDLEAVVPTNEMAVLITVNNRAKAKQFLDDIQSLITDHFHAPVSPKKANYRGTEITTFNLPIPVIPFAPSWALNDEVFIIASHDSLIREMLDIHSGAGRSIERNRYYSQLKQYVDLPSNFISFQDLESEFYTYREAMKRVSSLTDFGAEFLPDGEMLPFQMMDRISYLISCFQIMKATVKRHHITQDEMRMESYTLMEDLRSVPNMQDIKREPFSLGMKAQIIEFAGLMVQLGQTERAKRIYDILAEFYPDDKSYMLNAAEAFKATGDTEKAKQLYNEAVATSNQPSLFIELASMEEFDSANNVEAWLQNHTRNKTNFDSDAVLMGVALNAATDGNAELSNSLLQLIINKQEEGVFQSAAKTLLDSDNAVTIPLVEKYPTIDGMMDEAWGSEAKDSLSITTEDNAFTLHLSRSGAQLYGLAKKNTTDSEVSGEILTLYLCTNNQFHPVRVISINLSSSNNTSSMTKQAQTRVIDHWDMFPNWIPENLDTGWPVANGYDNNIRVIEFSIPFSILTDEELETLWGLNAKYVVEYEDGNRDTSWLVCSSQPDDPFGYIPITLE